MGSRAGILLGAALAATGVACGGLAESNASSDGGTLVAKVDGRGEGDSDVGPCGPRGGGVVTLTSDLVPDPGSGLAVDESGVYLGACTMGVGMDRHAGRAYGRHTHEGQSQVTPLP